MNKKHKLYYDIVYSELKQEAERNNIKISDDELEQQALGYLGLLQNEEDKYEAQLEKQRKENKQWFKTPNAFKNGYQPWNLDLTRTLIDSTVDAGLNLWQGGVDIGESTGKLIVNGIADLNDQLGNHEYAEKLRYRISGQDEKTNKKLVSSQVKKIKNNFEGNSIFGNKSDQIVEGAGYYAGMVSLQSIGVPWQVTAGTTSAGNELAEAYRNGATPEEARISALISATGEILSEYAFNGVKLKGTGKATDEIFGELSNRISNRLVRGLVGYGVNMMGEGFEEVLSGGISAIGKKLTYMSDKELNEIYSSDEALDEFVSGTLVTALTNGANPNTYQNIKEGRSLINGLTPNEQKVYNLEVQNRINQYEENNGKATGKIKSQIREQVQSDMSKGYIDIGTIESVLGDETYNRYQSIQNKRNSIKNEIEQLENMKANDMTVKQQERLQELRKQYEDLDTNSIENSLHSEVDNLTQNDRLLRTSYDEKTRRSQKFTVEDMNQYSDAKKELIQKAIDSNLLNNTNRTHEFVDFLSKIYEDKGVSFEFTNNENLKNSMFALDGKDINGFINDNNIFLNIDSAKSLNSVVGHEITHVLEGTEIYNELQEAVKEYATTKGEYESRLADLQDLYKDVENADVNGELTADLIGDYLFTDADFINHLSNNNKNIFQKLFNEIKYLYKSATAGSKEQRQLEKVKHLFEQAYNSNIKTSEKTQYSIETDKNGNKYVDIKANQNLFNNKSLSEQIKIAKELIKNNFVGKEFIFDGEKGKITNKTKNEYTHPSKTLDNKAYSDKLKASTELDNIIEISKYDSSKADDGRHAFAKNGWKYYKTTFKVGNNMYEGLLNVANDGTKNTIYDITQIKNINKKRTSTRSTSASAFTTSGSLNANTISQSNKNVKSTKYSLSQDNEGRQLSKQQQEYFKDSKVRDENGNLLTIYHTTTKYNGSQFNIFNPVGTENYKFGDQVVNFYSDSKEMSGSYADNSYKMADTSKINTINEAREWIKNQNTILSEYDIKNLGKDGYALTENGQSKRYFKDKMDLLKNVKQKFYDYNKQFGSTKGLDNYQYEGYLNITNPYIVDAKGQLWNEIVTGKDDINIRYINELSSELKQEFIDLADESINDYNMQQKTMNNYQQKLSELNNQLSKIDDALDENYRKIHKEFDKVNKEYELYKNNMSKFEDDLFNKKVDDLMNKLKDETNDAVYYSKYDLFQLAKEQFSDNIIQDVFSTKDTTNDIVKKVISDNNLGSNYDGLIIKNVIDYGNAIDTVPQNVYVTFNSNQFKAVDNIKPTSDSDIRYSLSSKGEMIDNKTGDKVVLEASEIQNDIPIKDEATLMAIHNLSEEKMKGILELGGFPVPSIAITNPNIVNHNEFGNISAIFDKETINPKNKKNEVYDRDVWSPTFPRIEYEINDNILNNIKDSIGLGNNTYSEQDSIQRKAGLRLYQEQVENDLNSGDLELLRDKLKANRDMQYTYLKNKNEIEPVYKIHQYNSDVSNEVLQQFLEQYQGMTDFSWNTKLNELNHEQTMALSEPIKRIVRPYLEEQYAKYGKEGKELIEKELARYDTYNGLDKFIYSANSLENNGINNQEIDEYATLEKVAEKLNKEEYEKWIDKTFNENLIKDKGIRNDKDIFTPQGNRRSFKATHNPVNLETLVKALSKKNTKGGQELSIFGTGFGRISAQTSNKFNSIKDIKNNENRLMTREEAGKIIEPLSEKLYNDTEALSKYYNARDYKSDIVSDMQAMDNTSQAIEKFASKELTSENLKKVLSNWGYNVYNVDAIPQEVIDNIIDDLNQAKQLPTDYFEAKPQRAVGLDEVQALVIPNNVDADFKQQLIDNGLNVVEYDPTIEGDRARIINEMQQYKFSLSNNNDIAPIGNYNVYGKDIALQNQQEEIPTTDTNDVYAEFGKMLEQGIEPEENPLDYIPQDPTKESTYEIKKSENGVMNFLQNEIDRKNNKRKEAMENRQYRIPTEKSSRKTAVDTLKHMFINRNVEIDNLARDTKNPNIKYAGDMLNNISAEAQNDIYVAQTNNQGEEIGVGLDKIFKRAKVNGLYNAFNDYLLHYSNIDRHQQGKGSKVSDAESRQLVHDYEKAYPQFESWGEDVWNYGKNLRQNLLDAGLIDTELYETLGKMYPHYVPYMENANLNGLINDTGEILPRKAIKKAEGGATHEALLPVEEALTRYTYAQKKAVRQNELYQQIVNTLNDTVEIGADTRQDVSDLKENLYRDDNGNYLTAYIDGERKSVRISDELYSSLKNDMENQVKDIEKRLSLLTKPLQKASNIRRNILTSWNPTFMATNFIKDIQDAMFNSKHTKDFIKNYPSAFKELVQGKSKLVKQFTALYGSGNLMGEYQVDSGLYNGKTKQKNQKFLRRISNMNNIIELAPRYAEFKASIENGASIQEAMYNAREVTTNFSRGGVITKALNRNGFTFLNANVQGLDKFIRNFSGENGAKGVVQSLIKATAFGVIPAVFNELAYGGFDEDKDEDYDALPDYIKDNYYLIKLGDGTFARIPKGRALSIFGSLARRTIEASEGEEDAFKGFLQNANSQIGISNPEENNLFAPLIQAKNNKAWYGGDLVPTRLQKKPTKEQYDETTDEFSKWLGDKLNVSPYKINYVLDQYSGGIGDMLLPLITEEASSGNTSAVGTALAPIKDKFVVNTTTDNKYVSEFYSKNDELQVRANSSEATDEDILRKKYMSEISSDLGKLYKEMHEVQSDTSLSKSEKYAKAQAIKEEINRLSKAGLDTYKDVNIGNTYATVSDVSYYKKSDGTWANVSQDEVNAIESMGLTDSERDSYFSTKNSMYDINQNYKELTENATNEEKTILNQEKKVEVINAIKSANITDEAKAYLYDKQYGDTKTLEVITAIDMDMNKYLDFEAQYFKADKNSKGKTINNSKKKKVFNYINSMDISFEEKCILAKLQYNSYNEYNYDIIKYLNESEIDYETELMILQKLGFNVTEDGKISW